MENKTYDSFNWRDTRIVILDCGEDKPDFHWGYYDLNDFAELRNEQMDFLKRNLPPKNLGKRRNVFLFIIFRFMVMME